MKNKALSIGILGPESSGKTTLCKSLSKKFSATIIQEYARKYLTNLNRKYNFSDLEIIYNNILMQYEVAKSTSHDFIFFDTELYNILVWQQWVFKQSSLHILKKISHNFIDIYILLYPDLPWEKDPLREYQDAKKRLKLFYYYLAYIISSKKPFTVIKGGNRLEQACSFLNTFKCHPYDNNKS